MTRESKTILDGLNLVDKFLFDETIENKEAFEAIISIVLGEEVYLKESPQVEKEVGLSPELRAIRLDVIGLSHFDKVMMMEMQKTNTYNLDKRSRFYQGLVDVSLLPPGEKDFNKLKDICMVFIAPFDPFGKGLFRYTFEGICRECPDLKLNDGAMRVFINTRGKNRESFSKEFLDFCDYVTESTDEVAQRSGSEKIKLIHSYVTRVRQSEKEGVKYMQKWEELAYARDEGREEGKEIGLKCLVNIVKDFCDDFESLYKIISNMEEYRDATKEQVLKYYN